MIKNSFVYEKFYTKWMDKLWRKNFNFFNFIKMYVLDDFL